MLKFDALHQKLTLDVYICRHIKIWRLASNFDTIDASHFWREIIFGLKSLVTTWEGWWSSFGYVHGVPMAADPDHVWGKFPLSLCLTYGSKPIHIKKGRKSSFDAPLGIFTLIGEIFKFSLHFFKSTIITFLSLVHHGLRIFWHILTGWLFTSKLWKMI